MRCRMIIIAIALSCIVLSSGNIDAQSFRKGSLVVSVSEGSTHSEFTTFDGDAQANTDIKHVHINGDRDPLIVEYGLTNRWGIGINMGGDVFHVNPSTYYEVHTTDNKLVTSELSAECNYHFYVTRKWDLAACGGIGFAGVTFKGTNGDGQQQAYQAGGGILRLSGKARYYVLKRFGILGILSAYQSSCTSAPKSDSGIAGNTTTKISGYAFEFGLCYRILR